MGLRVPEENEDPVAHVLCDETSEPLDGLSYRFLVRSDDLTKVFRVQ